MSENIDFREKIRFRDVGALTKILAATERDFRTLQRYYYYKQLFISMSYFSPVFVQSSLGFLRWH